MRAVLSNAKHPEYGQVTIPFPLAQDQYDDCVELLEKLGIGDVVERDCKVEEIQGGLPILKRLEKVAVNIDELDLHISTGLRPNCCKQSHLRRIWN